VGGRGAWGRGLPQIGAGRLSSGSASCAASGNLTAAHGRLAASVVKSSPVGLAVTAVAVSA
jgi:hypothetical protein